MQAAAEAVANGGVAAQLYGDSSLANDACYPSTLAWASFIDSHRHLFGADRRKQADVAILYSVPTRMWLQDTSMSVPFGWIAPGEASLPLSDVFSGMARVAEDHHILCVTFPFSFSSCPERVMVKEFLKLIVLRLWHENSKGKVGFRYDVLIMDHPVRKTPLFAPFIHKMHHLTKTGSGQTLGKLKKEWRVS